MKEGDLVRPLKGLGPQVCGIILDVWEDDYDGVTYYEVCWAKDSGWWKFNELELISESG